MALARLYLALMSVLLVGYAFLDKGFAYIGYAPVYVGELALAAGLFVAVCGGLGSFLLRSPITWAILAFALWGAFTTALHPGSSGILTLRDGVVWGYAAFALIVGGTLLRTGLIDTTLDWYGRCLPWFVVWVPIVFLLQLSFGDAIPLIPGSEKSLLSVQAADLAVHLAGAAAFLLLGLHQRFPPRPTTWSLFKEWRWWLLWSVGFLMTGSKNRGGLLAMLTALALVMMLRPTSRLYKLALSGAILVAVFVALNPENAVRETRMASPQQIVDNVQSIFIDTGKKQGTKRWRLEWWGKIVDYTVFGEYFWTGKGYGINLADSDGFQVTADRSLRSPHNAHMTILARSGVPGFALWLTLQGTIFFVLLRAHLRARRARLPVLANINLWLMAYWTAFNVNATFDVYFEGPQGGIWFWSLVGFAIAFTELTRKPVASPHNMRSLDQTTPQPRFT